MSKSSGCERARGRRPAGPAAARSATADQSPRRRVLVAFPDVARRIDVASCLMLAGHDVVLARSLDQRAGLIGAVHVVVADGSLVNGLGHKTHEALRRAVFIAVCDTSVPTPLVARVRFATPLVEDDLVTAVAMLTGPARGAPEGTRTWTRSRTGS